MMQKQIEMVKAFHELTENNWCDAPTVPAQSRLDLRAHLIIEEAREFEEAAKNRDIVEMADALADLLYVTFGSVGELGLGSSIEELFEEVQYSNMSKVCKTEDEAKETVEWYKTRVDGNRCEALYRAAANGGYLVERISDGKTLKSIRYTPANIVGILADNIQY